MENEKNANANANNGGEPSLEDLIKQNNEATDLETVKKLNTQIFARLKKTEEKPKDDKGNEQGQQNGDHKVTPPASNSEEAPITTMELITLQGDGYSNAEIINIAKLAKEMKLTPAALMANPILKAGIEAQRKQTRGRDGTPPPSSRVVSSILSNDEIPGYSEAKTPAERQKAVIDNARSTFEKRVQGKTGGSEE